MFLSFKLLYKNLNQIHEESITKETKDSISLEMQSVVEK